MLRRNSARKVHPMPLDRPTTTGTPWYDADTGRQLTASQQALVRGSWRVLAGDLEAYGLSMTSRILEIQPSAYALFRIGGTASCTLLRTHAVRMMETFGMVVEGLDDMDTVWPLLCMLGKHHAKTGIGPEHLQAVSSSLLWVLERALKDQWTAETRKAWCILFGLVEAGILSGLLSRQLVTSPTPAMRLSSSTRDVFIIPDMAKRSSPSSGHSSASSSRSSTPVSMETGRSSPHSQTISGRWATPAELTPGRWSLRTNRLPVGGIRGTRLRRTLTLADSMVNNKQALQRSYSNKV